MEFLTILILIVGAFTVTVLSTVFAVIWLVVLIICLAIYLSVLGLPFTALLYIIVYVGAIAILFIFTVQLLDLSHGVSNPLAFSTNLMAVLALMVWQVHVLQNWKIGPLSSPLINLPDSPISQSTTLASLAEHMYGQGAIALFLIGFVLLIGMVAPIAICKEYDY